MDPTLAQAAAGLRSRMESLDMLANNLANAGTGGFKADKELYGLYRSPDTETVHDSSMPTIDRQWVDFSQGLLQTSGNPLDLALSGKGFFKVKSANGPVYTRNGNFQSNATGVMVTTDGYPVLAKGGTEIRLKPQAVPEIAMDGTVRQEGQIVAQLDLVQFNEPAQLTKMGNTYFRYEGPQDQLQPANPDVHQGKLEGSNVGTAEAAVRLVNIMRQAEMLQKAISITTDMGKKTLEDVAHVGS